MGSNGTFNFTWTASDKSHTLTKYELVVMVLLILLGLPQLT